MNTITVIGAGTMGNGIAHVFAQNGFKVYLVDMNALILEKALTTIAKNLDRMVLKASITEDKKRETLANLIMETEISKAAPLSDLVVEAASENFIIKEKIFLFLLIQMTRLITIP